MKKKLLISSLILLVCTSLGIAGVMSLYKKKHYSVESRSDTLSELELAQIKPGDIILRKGKSFASDFITMMMNEDLKVSHCGLIVEQDNELAVIHSVSVSLSDNDGIQIQKLAQFINYSQPNSHIIVRYNGNDQKINKIINKAWTLLEQKLPFDNDFELNNGRNLYCSELFWEILPENFKTEAVSYKLERIIAFESFLHPDVFTVIINHRASLQ
jgi:hypothetical protein